VVVSVFEHERHPEEQDNDSDAYHRVAP